MAERSERHLGAGVFAEFLATLLFVVFGVGIVLSTLTGPTMSLTPWHIFSIAFAHGVAIYVLVSVFGGISGGHINPAVTFGLLCIGEIGAKRAFLYMIAQFSGATLGALLLVWFVPDALQSGLGMHSIDGNMVTPGFFLEALITMVLVLTVFMTAVKKNASSALAPLAIGMAVFIGIMLAIRLTGGSMNPARSLGPVFASLLAGSPVSPHSWVYLAGPGMGALLAAIIFVRFFRGVNV